MPWNVDRKSPTKEPTKVEWKSYPTSLRIGNYEIKGSLPTDWLQHTREQEIWDRLKENLDSEMWDYTDLDTDFRSFLQIFNVPPSSLDTRYGGCEASLMVELQRCDTRPCQPPSGFRSPPVRRGLWSFHIKSIRIPKAPGMRMNFGSYHVRAKWNRRIFCGGYYACDRKQQLWRRMQKACEELEIRRLR